MSARAMVAMMMCLVSAMLAAQPVPRVDIRLRAEAISMEELSRFVPALRGIDVPSPIRITAFDAHGPLDRLEVSFSARGDAAVITGKAIVDARTPRLSARGTIAVQNLALDDIFEQPALPSGLTANARFDLQFGGGAQPGVAGTFELDAPSISAAGYSGKAVRASGRIDGRSVTFTARGDAYGAAVRAGGSVVVGPNYRYDLQGSVSGVSLARLPSALPLPAIESALTFDYQVTGSGEGAHGRVDFEPSLLAGARIASGTSATFDTRGDGMTYRATGSAAAVNLQAIGELFDVDVLADPRLDSDIETRFDVSASNGVVERVDLDVSRAGLFGGRLPGVVISATRQDAGWKFSAKGRFEGIDPGVVAARAELDGSLTGIVDVAGTWAGAAPGASGLDAAGRVVLESSTIEGAAIRSGEIVARVAGGERVEIQRGVLIMPDGLLRVAGHAGLAPGVATALEYEIDTPALSTITDLIGLPLEGQARLQGTVTGTDVLTIAGTVTADFIAYREIAARSLTGRYRAMVPRDQAQVVGAALHVESSALDVATQSFEGVTAEIAYSDGVATFEVDGGQAETALATQGRLLWHPDHRELHISGLNITTPQTSWRLAAAAVPAIRFAPDQIEVKDFRLIGDGGQVLSANGGIGAGGAPLRIEAGGVQLSTFAPWLNLGGLEGVLNGSAVVQGRMASPEIAGKFALDNGVYRGVPFQSIGGEVDYVGDTITFDVRLVQPDQAWIEAEGRVASAIFSSAKTRSAAEMNVTVRSSPVDLAIVQLFTDQISEVDGTMQADAVLRGTLGNPDLQGQLVIQGGAFSVPQLGTRYTGVASTILLQPEAVVVDALRLVDDDRDWLEVSGTLPLGEQTRRPFRLEVRAQSFELMDNRFGDLEADALLIVSGRLLRPHLAGSVVLTGGRINADQVLDMADRDAYPTEASALIGPPSVDDRAARDPASAGLLEEWPVGLDLQVDAESLLVAGNDLRGPTGVPVGLGDINITARGDVRLQKEPDGPLRAIGDVQMVRGTYEFQNREFELVRGSTVRFTGSEAINPRLDITARRTISAVTASVHVTGTLEQPELELSSTPQLEDAEILSLIVFNRSSSQLGTAEQISLGQRAAALATGFLAAEISEVLQGALGLDLVEVEALSQAGSGLSPVLTVGEQFGDFYVRFRQQLGAEPASQLVLEYEVTDWLRVESSIVERGDPVRPILRSIEGSGIDAVASFEFGGPDEGTPADAAAPGEIQPRAGKPSGILRWLGVRK